MATTIFIHVLRLRNDNLKIFFNAATYKPQLVEHVREIMLGTTLRNTSHNSRDVILSHNLKNVTCLPSIPSYNSRDVILSHNSRNALAKPILKPLFQAYQMLDHGPRIFMLPEAAHCGPASTNLPARSPTLWTSPPIVQHT
ncbi:hypothetical protein DEO72_LG9g1499 [Vigna unguiculata]|uniref:Uncharacterized protein n=1 Tax=Vigna unguiculata TaxID=3917 RepID=A0A4D6MYE1_VIGUN|nr:hypothetical protein DEO72_LG9g1499 [Vigna unguiculata]